MVWWEEKEKQTKLGGIKWPKARSSLAGERGVAEHRQKPCVLLSVCCVLIPAERPTFYVPAAQCSFFLKIHNSQSLGVQGRGWMSKEHGYLLLRERLGLWTHLLTSWFQHPLPTLTVATGVSLLPSWVSFWTLAIRDSQQQEKTKTKKQTIPPQNKNKETKNKTMKAQNP